MKYDDLFKDEGSLSWDDLTQEPVGTISFDSLEPEKEPGFWEAALSDPIKAVPVVGSLVGMGRVLDDYLVVVPAAKRLEEGNYEQYNMLSEPWDFDASTPRDPYLLEKQQMVDLEFSRERDLEILTDYFNTIEEQQRLGKNWRGKAGLIAGEMPAYMGEFMLSGGIATAGKKWTKKTLEKALKEQAKRKIAKATTAVVGSNVSSGIRTATVLSPRVMSQHLSSRLPEGLDVTETGDIKVDWNPDHPATSFVKAVGSVWIDAFSEEAGAAFNLLGPHMKAMPVMGGVLKTLERGFKKVRPKGTTGQFLNLLKNKGQFHGLVGEIGEEFLSDGLQALVNIDDYGAGRDANWFQRVQAAISNDINNLPSMALAFSIPVAASSAIGISQGVLRGEVHPSVALEQIKSQEQALAQTQEAHMSAKIKQVQENGGPNVTITETVQAKVTPELLVDMGVSSEAANFWAERGTIPITPRPDGTYQVGNKVFQSQQEALAASRPTEVVAREVPVKEYAEQKATRENIPFEQAVKETIEQFELEGQPTHRDVLKTQLGKENVASLDSASKGNVNDVLDWMDMTGGMPTDVNLHKQFLSIAASSGRRIAKMRTAQQKFEASKSTKRPNALSWWKPIRHGLGFMEGIAKYPLRAAYQNMVNRSHEITIDINTRFAQGIPNTNLLSLNIDSVSNEAIGKFLFDGDMDAFNSLSQQNQEVASVMREMLQTEGKRAITSLRWKMWKAKDIIPEGVRPKDIKKPTKKQLKEYRQQVFQEGLQAESEGRIAEWLETQDWGARETYYMSESPESGFESFMDSLMPATLKQIDRKTRIGKTPREAHTRKSKAQMKRGDVIQNVKNHLMRLETADALYDPLTVFVEGFSRVDPSALDSTIMEGYLSQVLHRPRTPQVGAELLTKIRSTWWRLHFLHPSRNLYYQLRNTMQNIEYLGSQTAPGELAISVKKIAQEWNTDRADVQRKQDFDKNFETRVKQVDALQHQALLGADLITSETNSNVIRQAKLIADRASMYALRTDSWNRIAAWNLLYDAAQRNVNAYADGRMNWETVRRKLRLDTMDPSQQAELLQLADKQSFREFVNRFAEYRTEDIHFRYETAFRSPMEQNPVLRSLTGLWVYPSGVYNLVFNQGAVPLIRGVRDRDFNKAYAGLSTLLSIFAARSLTNWFKKNVLGKKDSLIPAWGPLDPGLSHVSDLFDGINQIRWRGGTTEEQVGQMLTLMGDQLEFFIPICETFINIYEANEDVKGVKFWQLASVAAKSEYKRKYNKRWTKTNRADWQKIMHILIGGEFDD